MESIDQKEKDGKRGNGRENRIETRGKEPVGKGWGIREKGERDRRRRGRYTTLFRDGSRSGVGGEGEQRATASTMTSFSIAPLTSRDWPYVASDFLLPSSFSFFRLPSPPPAPLARQPIRLLVLFDRASVLWQFIRLQSLIPFSVSDLPHSVRTMLVSLTLLCSDSSRCSPVVRTTYSTLFLPFAIGGGGGYERERENESS